MSAELLATTDDRDHGRPRNRTQRRGRGDLRAVTDEHTPPAAVEAEEYLIGATLDLGRIPDGVTLTPAAFYRPAHRTIWQAILDRTAAGQPLHAGLLITDLAAAGTLDDLGGQTFITRLWHDADGTTPFAADHARRIAETARQRDLYDLCHRLGAIPHQAGATPTTDQLAHITDLAGRLAGLAATPTAVDDDTPTELDMFLDEPDPEYDWLVHGLLERGDRVILTGGEGQGKTTFLRQLGVQLAAGIHPFDPGRTIPPVRVLMIDLENSRAQIRRALRSLRLAAKSYQPGHLFIESRPQGLDLYDTPDDRAWLDTRIRAVQPHLLIIGPLYKLYAGDPIEEKVARPVALFLDHLRVTYGSAILVEAHTPHPTGASNKRPTRPYGASLWLRWPEFGLNLAGESGMLTHWRGQREEREWPTILRRGGDWPWTCTHSPREETWVKVVEHVLRIQRLPSQRDLAQAIGVSKTTLKRALDDHRDEWAHMAQHFEAAAEDAAQ